MGGSRKVPRMCLVTESPLLSICSPFTCSVADSPGVSGLVELTNNIDCSKHSLSCSLQKNVRCLETWQRGTSSQNQRVLGKLATMGVQHTSVGDEDFLSWDFGCSGLGIRPGFGETLPSTRTTACTVSLA